MDFEDQSDSSDTAPRPPYWNHADILRTEALLLVSRLQGKLNRRPPKAPLTLDEVLAERESKEDWTTGERLEALKTVLGWQQKGSSVI